MKTVTYILFCLFLSVITIAQEKLQNYTDINGMKQGYWEKNDAEGNIVYKGYFSDNMPIGTFLRYHKNGVIKAEMIYDSVDQKKASVVLYDDAGAIAAKGEYYNKLKNNVWVYYSAENKPVVEEQYVNGKLHGIAKKFYPSGKIVESKSFNNGLLHGDWFWYYEDGTVRMKTTNNADKRSGAFFIYYPGGKPKIKGNYEEDYKHGKWTFYDEKGKVEREINYKKDIADNQAELDEKMSKELKEMDAKNGQIPDPQNFTDSPESFFNK
ncbi:MAG: toxin-antitoxin system YwqK family antitoxin [Bacteroidales bacterium]|nr:toxin-antitoxin system YwqK family antitoxin [Bacteroidales bacterium]